jgi:hypothetical protein
VSKVVHVNVQACSKIYIHKATVIIAKKTFLLLTTQSVVLIESAKNENIFIEYKRLVEREREREREL